MTPENAQTVGLKAVEWLIGNDELRGVFLGATGLSENDLRENLADAQFLGSVLDFLCNDDQWVISFCDANALAYTDPMIARQSLPGGEAVHWT